MNILAIDTSTKFLCAALVKNDRIIAKYSKQAHGNLSKDLVCVLKKLLNRARLEIGDIDTFGLGIGPGSFTGLRIGFSTIKGLNYSLKKPIIGISSLDIIAYNVINCDSDFVCPIIDAKRKSLYSCIYKKNKAKLKKITEYLLISPEKLFGFIEDKTVFLGDGLALYRNQIVKKLKDKAKIESENFWYPKPDVFIELVKEKIKNKSLSAFRKKVLPLYLYSKTCQVRVQN